MDFGQRLTALLQVVARMDVGLARVELMQPHGLRLRSARDLERALIGLADCAFRWSDKTDEVACSRLVDAGAGDLEARMAGPVQGE